MMRPQTRHTLHKTVIGGAIAMLLGIAAHQLWLALLGLLVEAGCYLVWRERGGSSIRVRRWARRSSRHDGLASHWQVAAASGPAIRRKAGVLLPSARGRSVPLTSIATPIARAGRFGPRIWSSIEHHTLRIGPPRSGKTGELACRVVDASGICVVTSTKDDVFRLTAVRRAAVGPVRVFNASNVGGIPSTVTFDPLTGCGSPIEAFHRAQDMITGADNPGEHRTSSNERKFWNTQATIALAALMHAAAIGGKSMFDVDRWVSSQREAAEAVGLLAGSTDPQVRRAGQQFVDMPERTHKSVTMTIRPALIWLQDPYACRAAGLAVPHQPIVDDSGVTTPEIVPLDVQQAITSKTTMYILGEDGADVAPLVTALTAHLARSCRTLARLSPEGRMDPAATFVLDEAPLICPIPLDQWTSYFGGHNITMHIAAQSRAQLRARWGDNGAATIVNNMDVIMLLPGIRDADDLDAWVKLIGVRDEYLPSYEHHGGQTSHAPRQVDVLTPAQLSNLPARTAVLIRRNSRPAIVHIEMAWTRPDIRAALGQSATATLASHEAEPIWSETTIHNRSTDAQNASDSDPNDEAGASSPPLTVKGDEDRSTINGHRPQAGSEPSSSSSLDREPPPGR